MSVISELDKLHVSHYYCDDDGWYNCPAHPDGCLNDEEGTECNCGADERNARLDAVITELKKQGF